MGSGNASADPPGGPPDTVVFSPVRRVGPKGVETSAECWTRGSRCPDLHEYNRRDHSDASKSRAVVPILCPRREVPAWSEVGNHGAQCGGWPAHIPGVSPDELASLCSTGAEDAADAVTSDEISRPGCVLASVAAGRLGSRRGSPLINLALTCPLRLLWTLLCLLQKLPEESWVQASDQVAGDHLTLVRADQRSTRSVDTEHDGRTISWQTHFSLLRRLEPRSG